MFIKENAIGSVVTKWLTNYLYPLLTPPYLRGRKFVIANRSIGEKRIGLSFRRNEVTEKSPSINIICYAENGDFSSPDKSGSFEMALIN